MQPIRDPDPKTYLIVGCHGSATSLVAEGLRRCGVSLGDYVVENVMEDRDFKYLNEDILRRAGGAWYDPPTEEAVLAVDAEKDVKALLAAYTEDKRAFKDPRASLTGKHYLPHLDGDAYLFCCFRRPGRTVASLQRRAEGYKRGDIREHMDRGLVDAYNRAVVRLIEEFCEL
jgi:hypothetical protein